MNKTNIAIEIENFILPLLKSKRTYLDIGANQGKASIPFINIFDSVIAFEPNPQAILRLSKTDGMVIEEVAISDTNGEATFTCPVNSEGLQSDRHGSLISHSKETGNIIKYKVKVATIDSYNFEDVDFIKIDTEGNELKVIQGAVNTLKKYKPIIYYENKRSREDSDIIKKLLYDLGYDTQQTIRTWREKPSKGDMLAIPR